MRTAISKKGPCNPSICSQPQLERNRLKLNLCDVCSARAANGSAFWSLRRSASSFRFFWGSLPLSGVPGTKFFSSLSYIHTFIHSRDVTLNFDGVVCATVPHLPCRQAKTLLKSTNLKTFLLGVSLRRRRSRTFSTQSRKSSL